MVSTILDKLRIQLQIVALVRSRCALSEPIRTCRVRAYIVRNITPCI